MSSNSIPAYYLRTTEPTSESCRQPTVSATTANSAGAPPRSPTPVSAEDRSGVGGSSDGQDEQGRIILPSETGERPSLSSGWSDAPWPNRRRPGSLYSIVEYEYPPPPPPPPPPLWTLESGVSRWRGHPEGPESCQPDTRRSSRRSSQRFPPLPLQCSQCRSRGGGWVGRGFL